jgi:DNA-binding beta-propeller fold protein YncE
MAWAAAGANYYIASANNDQNNTVSVQSPITDGTIGTPRTGTATRDSSIGTNFGITY